MACAAEVTKEDHPETAEQAREEIPRRYETWRQACEWWSDWERLKGNNGLGACDAKLGQGKDIDCVTPFPSAECEETVRRFYACQALGAEGSVVPLNQQRCGFGGVAGCSPENLAVIDGEPRTYEDTDRLWDEAGDCFLEQPDG
jgi:hypothetical protein